MVHRAHLTGIQAERVAAIAHSFSPAGMVHASFDDTGVDPCIIAEVIDADRYDLRRFHVGSFRRGHDELALSVHSGRYGEVWHRDGQVE